MIRRDREPRAIHNSVFHGAAIQLEQPAINFTATAQMRTVTQLAAVRFFVFDGQRNDDTHTYGRGGRLTFLASS
jgi:hypothetical protein